MFKLEGKSYDTHTTTNQEELMKYFREMVEIRRFELIAD
jgi:hypothetical protein